MFRSSLSAIIIFACFAGSVNASQSRQKLEESLYHAEGFLSVAPERSYDILTREADIAVLRESDQLRWHIALSKASRSQRDYKQMETSLELALGMNDIPDFKKVLPLLLESTGILLRNTGDVESAKLAYLCALDYSVSSKEKISLLGNYSIALIHEHDLVAAQKVITHAKNLAMDSSNEDPSNKRQIAKLENVLGVIAFDLDDFAQAITHFKASYQLHQEISKRDSIIIVGINLLFTALVVGDDELYERLLPNVNRLTVNSHSKAIEASLFWVNSAYQQSKNVLIDEQWKSQLQASFQELASDRIKGVYKEHLAEKLGVDINFTIPAATPLKNQGFPDSLKKIEQCDWESLQTLQKKSIESVLML